MSWLHEELAIVATIDPVDLNGSTATSDEIDMSLFSEIMVIIQCGVIAASATNTFTVQSSAAAGGSKTAISGKSQALVNTDDAKQFIISVKAEELTPGHRYVNVLNAGSAHSQIIAVLVLGRPLYKPGTDVDLSSVQTVVA